MDWFWDAVWLVAKIGLVLTMLLTALVCLFTTD